MECAERIFTIDFETTGIDPKTCHPVEVAVVGYDDLGYESFIKPPVPIPPETSAVHHITDEDVLHAETWEVEKEYLRGWLERHSVSGIPILVAHNAEYEKAILNNGSPFIQCIWICTYKCALRVWPEAPAHKNEVLRYWLGLGDNRGRDSTQKPHSAMHDAEVTYLLVQKLLEHAPLQKLVEWTEQPAKLPKMPMGKHFGQAWETVPAEYLKWILKQPDMREDVRFCAAEELKRRGK